MRIGGGGYFSGVNEEALLEDLFAHPDKTVGELYTGMPAETLITRIPMSCGRIYPCGLMAIPCLVGLEPLRAIRISPREMYWGSKCFQS